MRFSDYYNEEDLTEGLFDFKKSPILALVGAGFKKFKPTTQKINKIKGLVDPGNINQITKKTFDNMFNVTAADLGMWKQKSKDKGFIDKFILKLKEPFAKDYKKGILNPDLKDDFRKVFDLSSKWLIDSMDIYKLTNGGNILLMKVVDPYDGKIDKIQLNPKNPRQIEKDAVKNLKYYIALDKKGEKWFLDKKNMPYRQYISQLSNYSKDQLASEIEKEYADVLGKEDNEEKLIKKAKIDKQLPQWKAKISKDKYEDLMFLKTFNLKKLLGNDFKKSEQIKASDKITDGRRFYTTDGGVISLFKTSNNNYIVSSNDIGKDRLEGDKIIELGEFSEI